jgi:parallel beta-helix repeat protein
MKTRFERIVFPAWRRALAGMLLLALPLLAPAPARADTTACIGVTSLPATLVTPGRYCLSKDFDQVFAGEAIYLAGDDVVLDCRGHRIRTSGAPGTANGISSGSERRNVVVRNCVVDGFYVGIHLTTASDAGTHGNVIEDNTIVNSNWAGMFIGGSNNLIQRNRVLQGNATYNGSIRGLTIFSLGDATANKIRDNIFSDFKPTPPAEAQGVRVIDITNSRNTEVTGNIISGIYANTNSYAHAIVAQGATGATVSRNTILSPPPLPAPFDGVQELGIYMFGTPESEATNVCRDNVIGHFSTNITGCVQTDNTGF